MIVTAPAWFSTCAAAASDSSSGRTIGEMARIATGSGPAGASARNTSPGTTTTATPPRASAARMAISSTRGSWSGTLTNSQYTLHSPNSRSGWVSWK